MRFFLLSLSLAAMLGVGAAALAQDLLPATGSTTPAAVELPAWFGLLKNQFVAAFAVALLTQAVKQGAQALKGGEKPGKAWTVLASALLSLLAAAAAALAGGDGFDAGQAWRYSVDALEAFLLATGIYKSVSHAAAGAKAIASIGWRKA